MMASAISIFEKLNLKVEKSEFSEERNSRNELIGFHCSTVNSQGYSSSGGFGNSIRVANKIASAEFIERSLYKRWKDDPIQRKAWGLENISTACGFAVGFSREKTILRSMFEGVERLVISKWIDEQWHWAPSKSAF